MTGESVAVSVRGTHGLKRAITPLIGTCKSKPVVQLHWWQLRCLEFHAWLLFWIQFLLSSKFCELMCSSFKSKAEGAGLIRHNVYTAEGGYFISIRKFEDSVVPVLQTNSKYNIKFHTLYSLHTHLAATDRTAFNKYLYFSHHTGHLKVLFFWRLFGSSEPG